MRLTRTSYWSHYCLKDKVVLYLLGISFWENQNQKVPKQTLSFLGAIVAFAAEWQRNVRTFVAKEDMCSLSNYVWGNMFGQTSFTACHKGKM